MTAALAALLGGAAVMAALLPAPARAGEEGVVSVPAAGAVLTEAPKEVRLTFGSRVRADLSHVSVRDATGTSVADGEASETADGSLRLPVSIPAPGYFTVAYHVALLDGGEATGALRFSVGTGIAPPALDTAARQAEIEALSEHGHSIDGLSATLLVVDGAVLFGALGLLILRPPPRRRLSQDSPDHPAGEAG